MGSFDKAEEIIIFLIESNIASERGRVIAGEMSSVCTDILDFGDSGSDRLRGGLGNGNSGRGSCDGLVVGGKSRFGEDKAAGAK